MKHVNHYCSTCSAVGAFEDHIDAERSGRWKVIGWNIISNKPILECAKCTEARDKTKPRVRFSEQEPEVESKAPEKELPTPKKSPDEKPKRRSRRKPSEDTIEG